MRSPPTAGLTGSLCCRSDGQADTRTYHTGCPVLAGNKWIANKWVKWHGSMWAFPCSRDRGRHYRHFNNEGHRF